MERLRSTWLALMGGAVLVTLSVSAAFGAHPSGTHDGTPGQTIAGFVHELVLADENNDDEVVDEDEDSERQVPEEFANHGECVSEAAHDDAAFEDSGAANKGEWVSQNARYTCWGLDVPGDEAEDETVDDTDETSVDETDTDTADASELAAKEQAKAEKAAARDQAKADKAAARDAAKAERAAAKPAKTNGGGNGHAHGGGRP